jgi:hypothetical protein
MKVLIFLAAITLTLTANAQTDYVITVKGDSIACDVSTPFIGSIKYKNAAMRKAEKIKPDVIKEYYVARKTTLFRSVFKDSTAKPIFMTVVEKGKISLYELVISVYNGTTTTTTTSWYVGKGSDYVNEIKTNALFMFTAKQKRKDKFGEMLADNKAVYDKYKADDKFSFKQIENLVHWYNTGHPLDDPGKPKDPD